MKATATDDEGEEFSTWTTLFDQEVGQLEAEPVADGDGVSGGHRRSPTHGNRDPSRATDKKT